MGWRSIDLSERIKKKKIRVASTFSFLCSFVMHYFRFLLSFFVLVLGGRLKILCIWQTVQALDTINDSFTGLNDVIDIEHWIM